MKIDPSRSPAFVPILRLHRASLAEAPAFVDRRSIAACATDVEASHCPSEAEKNSATYSKPRPHRLPSVLNQGMGKLAIGLLAALLSSIPGSAIAEPPSVRFSPLVERDHQQNAGKVPVTQISREDCITDDGFSFTLELDQYQGYALEL